MRRIFSFLDGCPRISLIISMAGLAALGGCGGGSSGGAGNIPPPPQTYTIGGSITGLASGESVVLLNNSGDALTISANGAFVFSAGQPSGSTFTVIVGTQPTEQRCTVAQGTGTVGTQSVTSIAVTCTSSYPLEGTIWGLGNASGLVLANGSDTLEIPAGATSFTMPTGVPYGSSYDVTVQANPLALTCTVNKGTGTMDGFNVDTMTVTCAAADSILYSFAGGPADGATPGNIIQASDGNFYGVTSSGGMSGRGAIFEVTPNGTETILHLFSGGATDGFNARGGLIEANDGNFYGSTSAGGAHGEGIVFKITPGGTETVLYSFAGGPSDGAAPCGSLIQAGDGDFYGLTSGGGANGDGTVFRITPSGTETVLYSFSGAPKDGSLPDDASLIQASDGNLYGLTSTGGTSDRGTVFMVTPDGIETVLHSFGGGPTDGAFPNGHLIQASDGNFYGVTPGGGDGYGTVFKITPAGNETLLYSSFDKTPAYDISPQRGLLQGSDGNFYGISAGAGGGSIFEITAAGAETHLYAFAGGTDGEGPVGLIQASDGKLYGTTSAGGAGGDGAVFMLK